MRITVRHLVARRHWQAESSKRNVSSDSVLRELLALGSQPSKEDVAHVLSSTLRAGFNEKALTQLLTSLGQSSQSGVAIQLLGAEGSSLRHLPVKINIFHCNAGLSACEKQGAWEDALSVFECMRLHKIRPDIISYNTIISACHKGQHWGAALSMFSRIGRGSLDRDSVTYNSTITACAKGGKWRIALQLLARMELDSIRRDAITCSAIVIACGRARHWQLALKILHAFESGRLHANAVVHGAALTACQHGKAWRVAVQFLHELEEARLRADTIAYVSTASACEKASAWEVAIAVLKAKPKLACRDTISHNVAINSCAAGHNWILALQMCDEMRKEGLSPDAITFNSTITACERATAWQAALAVLMQMRSVVAEPNKITINATLGACNRAALWQEALSIVSLARSWQMDLDSVGYGIATLMASQARHWEASLRFLDDMQIRAIEPDLHSFGIGLFECEQRGLWKLEASLILRVGLSGEYHDAGGRSFFAAALNAMVVRLNKSGGIVEADKILACGLTNDVALQLEQSSQRMTSSETQQILQTVWTSLGLGGTWPHHEPYGFRYASLQSSDTKARYSRVLSLLRYVWTKAQRGNAASVCDAVERFGTEVLGHRSLWLKVVGSTKAHVLVAAMAGAGRGCRILEIGTYCGYSAIKMASSLPGSIIDTLEVDPVHVIVARNLILFAGLADCIDVWTGHSKNLIPQMVKPPMSTVVGGFGGVFMDQRGSRYHEDLQLLEQHGLMQKGTVVVADNVLKPGAPFFLWHVAKAPMRKYETLIIPVREFAMPAEDWMSVSIATSNRFSQRCNLLQLEPPDQLFRLHEISDAMRRQAFQKGDRVTFQQWAAHAATMKSGLAQCGIHASRSNEVMRKGKSAISFR